MDRSERLKQYRYRQTQMMGLSAVLTTAGIVFLAMSQLWLMFVLFLLVPVPVGVALLYYGLKVKRELGE